MKIKKTFAMHEFLKEEEFLNEMAAQGKCLEKALGDGFQFKECDSYDAEYKVVYSLSDFNSELYKGFQLVSTYTSSKGGHYYYLKIEDPDAQLPENEDRNFILEKNLRRIERFNGIITGSLLILFVYLYITYRNPLYFIIIGAAVVLGGYIFNLGSKIKKGLRD